MPLRGPFAAIERTRPRVVAFSVLGHGSISDLWLDVVGTASVVPRLLPRWAAVISALPFRHGCARRTVTVELDEDLVERARERSGRDQAKDAEVVEEALAVYLGMKALDEAQAESRLSEEEASKLAYEELRAPRQGRRGAA
jgi:hypothetical protein